MQEAAIERLTKLLSNGSEHDGPGGGFRSRKPAYEIRLGLAEGWFSLFLLAAVVYSTIWSVQAVGWVAHLNVLSLTTALGLISGVIAAKQRRFPRLFLHSLAIILSLVLAFWQTAGAFYEGSTAGFLHGMQNWFMIVVGGGTGDDDSIFLFFIVTLGFILAYTSAWLVYRTRSPWLMVGANAIILLINLNNVDDRYIVFLIIFLIASLLLLLRFNLYESVRRWQVQGLRYSDDIGWDIMQAGVLISIGILIFSWILPWGYTDATASQIWNANAWVQVQNTWNRVISVSGGTNPSNHGNFRDTLVLGGNPNLNHDVVLTIRTNENANSPYLMSLNYDIYTGRSWINGATGSLSVQANQTLPSDSALNHVVTQDIAIVSPPGEQSPYLLGASDIVSVSQSAKVMTAADGTVISWLAQSGRLVAGSHYTVTSLVSSADEKTLRSVPMPVDAPKFPANYDGPLPATYYNPAIVQANVQLPNNLDPQIADLAREVTAQAPTMYDKVVALETFLRTNYTYSLDVQLPPGEEGVSWFLFRGGHKGFCNYFSSAMAVMARSLGIPARVAVGYTGGENDAKNHQHVVRGTDAHSWTQVYFAGYGWINFEPSAGFSTFSRPLPNQFPGNGASSIGTNFGGKGITPPQSHGRNLAGNDGPDTTTTTQTQISSQTRLHQQVGAALGSIILLLLFTCMLFGLWWRRLFHHYDLPAQLYGRLCLLAGWAGIKGQPSQTPYEYIQGVVTTAPKETSTLERLGDIYVRGRWADPESLEHPRRSGEVNELPGLWKHLQPRLFFYVLRHPDFLRWLPRRLWSFLANLWGRQRAGKLSQEDF